MRNPDLIRIKISNIYIISIWSYLLPYIIFLILIIDSITFELTDMFPLGPFLVSLFPISFVGCIFNIYGLIKSYQINDYIKKENGWYNLLIGSINLILGLFGLGIVYVVTN